MFILYVLKESFSAVWERGRIAPPIQIQFSNTQLCK